jgi:hypothetical protein
MAGSSSARLSKSEYLLQRNQNLYSSCWCSLSRLALDLCPAALRGRLHCSIFADSGRTVISLSNA